MATESRSKLKTAFKNSHVVAPLYTGGPVAITQDGSRLVTCVGEEAILTDLEEGREICRFAGDTESITALCVPPSASYLVLFTSSLSLRIYELPKATTPLQKHVQPIRVVARAHDAPVHVCKSDPTSTYLASGSADGVVKVWDIARGYVTHVFKGHGGVVSALVFNFPFDPSSVGREQKMQLITASVDTRIRIFDLSSSTSKSGGSVKPDAVLEEHSSVPRGLDVTRDGRWLVSGGRDSLVFLWDISSKSSHGDKVSSKGKGKEKERTAFVPTLVKTITVHERVEAVGFLRDNGDHVASTSKTGDIQIYTGGEKGAVKIWDARSGSVLFTLGHEQDTVDEEQEEQRQILDVLYNPSNSIVISVHADQNILFHSLTTRSLTRQLVGFNDEIVDATFLSPYTPSDPVGSPQNFKDTHIAFATNSSLIRVYSTSKLDARLLSGHAEIVLCLDRDHSRSVLASGSKDRSARIWSPVLPSTNEGDSITRSVEWRCTAICEGHTESVGAIAMSRKPPEDSNGLRFMFTGSQDKTIKMWDLSPIPNSPSPDSQVIKCKSLATHKAHEKDINSLDVAPNDRLLASGSQDRTAKIWQIEYTRMGDAVRGEIKLLGTCKGHKRGVWSVKFSRTERILATGSGDKTVKLWSLDDFSCLKTFEGHTNSVLRVDFINAGMQLVSAASDGLVKLWNIREEQCTTTLDNHEDKIWALAVSSDESTIVSGAADSVVTFWKDCTEEQEQEKESKRAELVLKEQDFMNYISLHDYRNAILLALAMSQPGRLFSLFKSLSSSMSTTATPSLSGHPAVDEVLRTLPGSDLARLLRYIRDWNANAKTSAVAQRVLHTIVKTRAAEDVMNAFSDESSLATLISEAGVPHEKAGNTALKDVIEGLIPYTERHLARMEKLVQESYVVDYLLGEMDDGMFGAEYDLEEEEVHRMEIDTTVDVGA